MNFFRTNKKKSAHKPVGSGFREAVKYALCAVLVLVGALAYIWPHIRIVNLGYERDKLQKTQAKLIQENRLMRIEVANLRSLAKIENIAVEQLKMIFPPDSQVVIVRQSQEKKEDTGTEGAGTGEKKHPGAEKNVEKKEGA